jgi:hypothetical protein
MFFFCLKDTECVKETAVLFESDLLDELLSSQKQAAHFLELARLALRDDPVIASKVGINFRSRSKTVSVSTVHMVVS